MASQNKSTCILINGCRYIFNGGGLDSALVLRMSRLARDGTAEPVPRDQILRRERGQGNVHFPCSADFTKDWQPYLVDPNSAICDNHIYILYY